ncbi:MAG: sodium:dicarboxylate symporter [Gemmatimonadetes bacterium]|nr:sodium:dicarboxylate symporter [Gemmatimonadota bacterium]
MIVGSVIGASHSAGALRAASWLAPVGQLWVNAIRMTIVPLVVSLLFVSIASRETGEGLGTLTGVTVATFFGLLAFAAVVALLLGPPLIGDMKLAGDVAASLRSTATAGASGTVALVTQLPGFGAWLTGLVPANVIKAAADGAMLPLIVFTLLMALASRHIEPALRQALIDFFAAIAAAMTRVVEWIIAAAPIGIFALVVSAAARVGVALAGAMAYYILAISAALVLFAFLMYPLASMIGRIPLGWFVRAAVPAQAVALSSSSSLASLPALIEGARALGLPPQVTGFVLPLSVSTFKVATPITWLMGTLFLAKLYGVTLGITSLVTIAITAVALSLTIPGVPQGAQLLLAPLLVTYGIPPEGVALLIAVDTIPDLVGTMTNVTGDLVVAVITARLGVAEVPPQAALSADA